jgi:hypothetical protein
LPERQSGETTRTYWTRVLLATPAEKRAQRAVVHAAAKQVLGLTLDRTDLCLVGQLRRVAGSWGTVLHWVLKTGDVAAVDVRAYLHGFVQRATPESAPPLSWLAETEEVGDAASLPPGDAAEDDTATQVRKLGTRLRAQGVWRTLELDEMVPDAYHQTLLTLDALRAQGAWPLTEFVSLVRILATPAVFAGATRSHRWGCLLAELQCRVRQRQSATLASPLVVSADGTSSSAPEEPTIIDPALLGRRAQALRRVCGAGTDVGQALLAYVELDEREALEQAAAILLRAQVAEEQDGVVVTRAWQDFLHRGTTVQKPTRTQRQQQWCEAVRAAAITVHHQAQGRWLS